MITGAYQKQFVLDGIDNDNDHFDNFLTHINYLNRVLNGKARAVNTHANKKRQVDALKSAISIVNSRDAQGSNPSSSPSSNSS